WQKGRVKFQKMTSWVGTELKKGPLWDLKDLCHSLFRDRKSEIGVCEMLFDWILGSIFHECMKLKEDIYQIEAYWPRYEEIQENEALPLDIREMINEYGFVIKKTEEDLKGEMERINYLFSKATFQLRNLLPNYSKNGLLIKFLIENPTIVDRVFGKNSLDQIFDSMYQRGYEDAYYVTGTDLLEGGWYEKAIEFFEKVLEINPSNAEARESLNRVMEICGESQRSS
ncbi:MAG: tetratricopeptide repeat protein, partial [Pseudomonadota bacterium]